LAAGAAWAQEAERPLSVIDWFGQHSAPDPAPQAPAPENKGTGSPPPPAVAVSVLGAQTPDSVGLISPAVSGLPLNLWKHSETEVLAAQLDQMATPRVPALNILLTRMMLAEADGPDGTPGSFLAARAHMLGRLGAVQPAIALLERGDPTASPQVFRQWAELKLLDGAEGEMCARLNRNPMLLPDYDYRVFCLARDGNWSAAATTLLGAEILQQLTPDEVLLLTRYLDPDLFEDEPLILPPTPQVSPLEFRILESVGEALPTDHLPLAYANWDLKGLSGWRAQLVAAERLGQTGAVSENLLLGIYSANLPSASGGVWARVATVQELDDAVQQADPDLVANVLPRAWRQFETVGLRSVLANLYGDDLQQIQFRDPDAEKLAHEVGLLSRSYQFVAWNHTARDPRTAFLNAIASGTTDTSSYPGILPDAIRRGFAGKFSEHTKALLNETRPGEALLHVLGSVTEGQDAPPHAISDAIALFEALGLTDTARQYALQLMLDHDADQ
jgi:hypothetical protein